MFDKLDTFNFHIAGMPSIASNLPSVIFYGFTLSVFARIAKSTLLLKDFLPAAKHLLN